MHVLTCRSDFNLFDLHNKLLHLSDVLATAVQLSVIHNLSHIALKILT